MLGRLPKIYQKEKNKSSKVHNGLENESVVDFNWCHAIVIFYAERLFHSLLVQERTAKLHFDIMYFGGTLPIQPVGIYVE